MPENWPVGAKCIADNYKHSTTTTQLSEKHKLARFTITPK